MFFVFEPISVSVSASNSVHVDERFRFADVLNNSSVCNFLVEIVVSQNHADVEVEGCVSDSFDGDVADKGSQEGGR